MTSLSYQTALPFLCPSSDHSSHFVPLTSISLLFFLEQGDIIILITLIILRRMLYSRPKGKTTLSINLQLLLCIFLFSLSRMTPRRDVWDICEAILFATMLERVSLYPVVEALGMLEVLQCTGQTPECVFLLPNVLMNMHFTKYLFGIICTWNRIPFYIVTTKLFCPVLINTEFSKITSGHGTNFVLLQCCLELLFVSENCVTDGDGDYC